MGTLQRPLAVVTGASTGIGYELAKLSGSRGYDLVVVADEPEIHRAAETFRATGAHVDAVEADLATVEGLFELTETIGKRPVSALMANAGRGLGHAFLDQAWDEIRKVIHTNVTGTLYIVHAIGMQMRERRRGRILIVGSIAGYMPGTFSAVYNGSKAFLDSFSYALRAELEDTGVTVTCLMPGATETKFFDRAGMRDTKVGSGKKQSAEEVARLGFEAMERGDAGIVTGFANKLQVAMAHLLPSRTVAKIHATKAAPGTAKS